MGEVSAAGVLGRLRSGAAPPQAEGAMLALPDRSEVMAAAGPGWYYDPLDEAVYRYWDGERWTHRRSDLYPSSQMA